MLPDGVVNSRRRIVDLLVSRGALSRADLARLTRLSKPAISGIVADLVEEGIVVEGGAGTSTGGRRPIMLHLGGTARLVAGVELDACACRFLLATLAGEAIARCDRPPPDRPDDLSAAIGAGLAELLGDRPMGTLIGCGVAIPGLIDRARDRVSFAGRPAWRDLPLRSRLQDRLGLPVMITDRGKAAGLGELWTLGHGRRDDLIYLYLGRGVAGALVLDNVLRLGPNHTAGEIGHTVVDPAGPRCDCGRTGCLEAHISTTALLARARTFLGTDADTPLAAALRPGGDDDEAIDAIGAAAARGDAVGQALVDYAARWLGLALGNLINAVNPTVIVLGGPLARWDRALLAALERHLDREALPIPRAAVRVTVSKTGPLAAAVGAAALVIGRAGELLAEQKQALRNGIHDEQGGEFSHAARNPIGIALGTAGH